jgi:FkbM family methyltransferase
MQVEYRDGWMWPEDDWGAWDWLNRLEPELPQVILKHVTNFNTCIHAGAHAGFYIKQYAPVFKRVYAVEPHPRNFFCLVNNIQSQNVFKIQACLSDERTEVSLWTDDKYNSGGFSICPGEDFPCIKIDDLVGNVGLIHLDVEKHELFALRGGLETIDRDSPVIVCETAAHNDSEPVIDLLDCMGYTVAEKLRFDTIFTRTK